MLLALLGVFGLVENARAGNAPCSLERPCELSGENGGSYYLGFPKGANAGRELKPFVFFHGHNGSGKGVAKNKGMIRTLARKGYFLIAPDGPMFNFRGRSTRGWAARPEGDAPRGGRNDIAFVERVLADVARRLDVDVKDVLVSGFSSGGSMAWYFACYSNVEVSGVIAVAGGLRRPLPELGEIKPDGSFARRCPSMPRKVYHLHGFADRQVPLEGRGIRSWHQGDVFEGLAVQRHTNGCGSRPDKVETSGKFWCRTWSRCESDVPLRMCLHGGGHGMPKGWLDNSLKWVGG